MYKKFQVNRTKIKGGCQSETVNFRPHGTLILQIHGYGDEQVKIFRTMYLEVNTI